MAVTIEILNEKAMNLLQDMEQLGLIKIHKEEAEDELIDWNEGKVADERLKEMEEQLNSLGNE